MSDNELYHKLKQLADTLLTDIGNCRDSNESWNVVEWHAKNLSELAESLLPQENE